IKPKWLRIQRIMALVPPENAPSDSSSDYSEDEVIIQQPRLHDDENSTYCSSEPKSYPSSLNNLDIFGSADEDFAPPAQFNSPLALSDEETIPLSPVINQMFPTGAPQEQLPFMLNSVSSVLSPLTSTLIQLVQKERLILHLSGAARCINVTTDDIKDFLAITLLMGVVQMPAYRDYWSNVLRYPLIADVMTLKKYEQIRFFFYFVDNTDMNDDRYFKTIKEKPATVFFDNFFTSLELIHHLRNEYGIFSLGTVKSNRLRGCETLLLSDKAFAKKGRASSYVDTHPKEKIKRYSKETKSRVDVECPQIVKQYNAHMGGVDLADMFISLYRSSFKTKRWYMALFTQGLDICVNNAWLLHKKYRPDKKKQMTLKTFRIGVIKAPVAPRPPDSVRYDNVGHLPTFVSQGRCKYCKKGYSSVCCTKCNLRLCMLEKRNCFYQYHVNV
ncbi:Uncharacterized protein OBRU01_06358, partial [Operophtera brumata]